MDDHGAHQYHAHAVRDDYDDESTLDDEAMSPSSTIEEVRFGIRDSHDIEANRPELRSEKSARSIKDPNLVRSLPTQQLLEH